MTTAFARYSRQVAQWQTNWPSLEARDPYTDLIAQIRYYATWQSPSEGLRETDPTELKNTHEANDRQGTVCVDRELNYGYPQLLET